MKSFVASLIIFFTVTSSGDGQLWRQNLPRYIRADQIHKHLGSLSFPNFLSGEADSGMGISEIAWKTGKNRAVKI